MLPEPNFPVKPDEFIGRRPEIEAFRLALQQGLLTGRTSSFAVLGDWGMGKSSLLLKFAAVSAEPTFGMLPVFLSSSKDIRDYLRLAECLLDKFAETLANVLTLRARLRSELQNWRLKRATWGGIACDRKAPPFFLSSGSALLRHTLIEAWRRFVQPSHLKGSDLLPGRPAQHHEPQQSRPRLDAPGSIPIVRHRGPELQRLFLG